MKCFVCGNELGNNRYCRMCGADNGDVGENSKEKDLNIQQTTDDYVANGFIYGGNSEYAYENANILTNSQSNFDDVNNQPFPDGTTVLTYDEIVSMSNSDISEKKNEKSKETKNNIIPEYEKPKSKKILKKEEKELKKSQQGYVNILPFVIVIIILGVLLLGVTAFLIYYVFFGRKEYIEIMPEVSASIYIDDTENQQVLSSDGLVLTNLDDAEVIAKNKESALFSGISGNLVRRYIDGKENDMGTVEDYYANDNLTTIVCLVDDEGKYNVDVWYDDLSYNVENQLNDVKDVVISDQNGYFAFFNEYEETYWEENSRLENGGENITVIHRDIYLVNENGESKMIYSTEDDNIVINYVTNNGYVFFTEENKNGTYIIKDGETKLIGSDCKNMVYYEDIDQYIMIDNSNDLYYGVISSRTYDAESIATDIDFLVDIGGNQMQDGYGSVGSDTSVYEGGYSYSDTPQITYGKNGSAYFIRPEYMEESIKIDNYVNEVTDIYSWNNEKIFFVQNGSLGVISLISHDESEEKNDEYIETWSKYELIQSGINDNVSVLTDGNFLFEKDGNLYTFCDDGMLLLRENVQNFCANDNSSGYMYVKNGVLYYSYGASYEEDIDVYISDATNIDYMISNNHTVYYYSVDDETVYCIDMNEEKSELLFEGIKATDNDIKKILIIRESNKNDI